MSGFPARGIKCGAAQPCQFPALFCVCRPPQNVDLAIPGPMATHLRRANEQAWSQRVAAVAMDARNFARFATAAHERRMP